MTFPNTTFFENTLAQQRQFAAACLALRGHTVDLAFLTIGPAAVLPRG